MEADSPICNLASFTSATGRIPSRALFKEYAVGANQNPDDCPFSITEWRKIFVDTGDITEYDAAIKFFGSWEDWETFKRNWPYFRTTILKKWKEELEIKLRSDAVREMVRQSKASHAAARWIAEGGYKPKAGKGRPAKAEVEAEENIRAAVVDNTDDDVARVRNGMKVVK